MFQKSIALGIDIGLGLVLLVLDVPVLLGKEDGTKRRRTRTSRRQSAPGKLGSLAKLL
ncbi:MAG: hypothetical protein H0T95_08270 [Chthoniobacterales bacterium]|nr:hypothetical protein [Chthoniobacterales bacterium]